LAILAWRNSDGSNNGGNAGFFGTNTCNTTVNGGFVQHRGVRGRGERAAFLCTYTDWRMPTRRELLTLVDAGNLNPSIAPTYFPKHHEFGLLVQFVVCAGFVARVAGRIHGGGTAGYSKLSNVYVRLVRGGSFRQELLMTCHRFALAALSTLLVAGFQARAATSCTAGSPNTTSVAETTPTSAFVNNIDGTLTHGLTGLTWKRCAQGASGADCATGMATTMTWSAALAAAVADTTGGHKGLAAAEQKGTRIHRRVLRLRSGYQWDPVPGLAFVALLVWVIVCGISRGRVERQFQRWQYRPRRQDTRGYVRLVRGGQSFGDFDASHLGMIDIDGNGTADALTDGLLAIR
jgi:hypothetical protein